MMKYIVVKNEKDIRLASDLHWNKDFIPDVVCTIEVFDNDDDYVYEKTLSNIKSVKVLENGTPKKMYVCTSCLKSGLVERA